MGRVSGCMIRGVANVLLGRVDKHLPNFCRTKCVFLTMRERGYGLCLIGVWFGDILIKHDKEWSGLGTSLNSTLHKATRCSIFLWRGVGRGRREGKG